MAIMIPDKCPSGASTGEKKLFSILQTLPDDHYVYYEPILENRYPDFIIICPDLGVLIVDVKGWRVNSLIGGDNHTLKIKQDNGSEEAHVHPIVQAQDYMKTLVSGTKDIPGGDLITNKIEGYGDKFLFPFGHFIVLSNITADQLTKTAGGDMTSAFPADKLVTRDELLKWEEEGIEGRGLKERLKMFFDPFWEITPLSEEQVKIIRATFHSEIIVGEGNKTKEKYNSDVNDFQIKVLDAKQEGNARSLGTGHRIIYGVAGSGKTVLLIARAKIIAEQQPDKKILFVCYNVSLSSYLQGVLSDFPNITVVHFDGLTKMNGVVREYKDKGKAETNESLGQRFLNAMENEQVMHRRYFDAVMVDEAQDFDPSWYSCLLELIKDPDDGDFIIVGDGSQGIYGNKGIVWKDLGIKAIGRTVSKNFDLNKNYRNTKEILELAAFFSTKTEDLENEFTLIALEVNPDSCERSGYKPRLVETKSPENEVEEIKRIVQELLNGTWFGHDIRPLSPEQIGIFYPHVLKRERHLFENLVDELAKVAPVVWINRSNSERKRINEKAIKIQTIHSSKGLQYKAVILMWADRMPRSFDGVNIDDERKLFYVALSRPEDLLVITTSGRNSRFIEEVRLSGKVNIKY